MRTSTATAPAAAPVEAAALYRTPRVFIAAAWVAIVAGIVFIVSVIFFTGMALGHHGGGHHHHKHPAAWMHQHRMGGPGGQGGQGGPGAVQPGGPGAANPGAPGPSQTPSSVAPSRTP
ncbi:MAG TPA: hypothetical protein VME67_19585 [Mycobacterium sp.]|nr:hypothetical protein [Mycobacterium sp.]HTX96859.1 hypothetical protein [Mycobacterium sp.]